MSEDITSRVIEKAKQWDTAFSSDMTDADVQRLLSIPPFSTMDVESFPANAPLDGILRNETRILRLDEGGIVVRQGDYGSSAFLLLKGKVRVVFDIDEARLGRAPQKRKSFMQALAQLWKNDNLPEVRSLESYRNRQSNGSDDSSEGTFLHDVPGVLNQYKSMQLTEGELFGEMSALTRSQRGATIIAENQCEVLEIK